MIWDYFVFSYHNFRSRKIRTFLTMLGIFIGIAAVVALISISSGLEKAIIGQFAEVGTDTLTVQAAGTVYGPPGSTAVKKLTNDDFNAIKKVNGIKIVAKRFIRTISFEYKDELRYTYATTLPEDDESKNTIIDAMNIEILTGRQLKSSDKYKAVIGNDYHTKNIFSRKIKLGDSILINNKKFEVAGILEKMGNPQFNNIVILNEKILEEILDIEDETDMIIVQIDNVEKMDSVKDGIEKALRKSRDVEEGKENFKVETPQQAIEALTTILNVVQAVIIGIAAISLVVGGIGIMNTMYTSVLERTKEIGIMKSIGAKNSDILLIFLIDSGILGLVGGLIGIILGVSFAMSVELIGSIMMGPGILQAHFSFLLIFGSLIFSFLVGMVSGIFPARQASQLQPIDALRK